MCEEGKGCWGVWGGGGRWVGGGGGEKGFGEG